MKRNILTLALATVALLGSASDIQAQKSQKLFNGKNLSNWNFVVDKNAVPAEQVFSVKDGLIRISGEPFGYMYTKEKHSNYKLHVEWRWVDGKPSNSGIFLLIADPKNGGLGEKGIVVFNTPGANANAVKELVIAGMLIASRDIIGGSNWANTLTGDDAAKQVALRGARHGRR